MAKSQDDDIVCLATGNQYEVAVWQQVLEAEGIRFRVLRDVFWHHGSAEIWVCRSDAERAALLLESNRNVDR